MAVVEENKLWKTENDVSIKLWIDYKNPSRQWSTSIWQSVHTINEGWNVPVSGPKCAFTKQRPEDSEWEWIWVEENCHVG